jgi:two-component system, response regulator YesN
VYSLLIVDDEPLSQVGLKSMVDWQSLDVQIVGTAQNGLAALDAIGRLRPDIVIADLRMPMLDGLGLVERCLAEPDGGPAFIVVTGYADFDSLRRAMRGSVVDYLLKLELDEAALRASVEKAKAAVRERKRAGLGAPSPAGGEIFAETALTRLLTGERADAREAGAALERSGLPIGEGGFRVALFKVEYASEERLSEDERLRAYCCAIDMLKQVVGREAPVLSASFDVYTFAAILGSTADRGGDEGASRAVEILDRARDVVGKYFGVSLRAGLGAQRREAAEAADSYREARSALALATDDYPVRAFDRPGGRDGQLGRDDLGGPGDQGGRDGPSDEAASRDSALARSARERPTRARPLREAAREALDSRSAESLRAIARSALEELGDPGIGLPDALALCCEILYPILERLDGAQELLDSLFPDRKEGWHCLFSASGPGEAADWLDKAAEGAAARLESAEIRGRNPLVAGVRRYVLDNYASRLSLADVARRFDVSPNHLSTLFKKYAGVGFADFVAQVKVEKAKELIASGRYKMFQIAQLVGFEDAFYFSKVFKRVSGMSPRDYYLTRGERGPSGDDGALSGTDE